MTDRQVEENYFHVQIAMLKVAGTNLRGSDPPWYSIYKFVVYMTIMSLPLVQVWSLMNEPDYGKVIEDMLAIPATIGDIIRMVYVDMRRRDVMILMGKLEGGVFAIRKQEGCGWKQGIIQGAIRIINQQAIFYLGFCIAASVFGTAFCLIRFVREEEKTYSCFVAGNVNIYGSHQSPTYELTLLFQLVTFVLLLSAHTGSATIIIGFYVHIGAQFRMLRHYIDNLTPNSNSPRDSNKNKTLTLSEIIMYHTEIKELAKQVESLFANIVLVGLLASLITTTLQLYLAAHVPIASTKFGLNIGLTFVNVLYPFCLCFWGQQVSNESSSIATACYNIDFVGTDVRFQKALRFMIESAQTPTTFTAGSYSTLSLATFQAIMQTSYSYLAILRSMN